MKLGIFGGTFDPVHYGHLLLAETCREQLSLDAVHFLPAGDPPHKSHEISDGRDRARMVNLAVSGYPEFIVDEREIRRSGPSWTVLTLQEFAEEHPDSELFFLMGVDSLEDFPGWRQPETILELATVVAVNRPGHPLPDAAELDVLLQGLPADRVRLVSMPGTHISSSDLRQRVSSGRSIRFQTPRAVEVFLREHKLYEDSP